MTTSALDGPPVGGELLLTIPTAPVTIQARAEAKAAFRDSVRRLTREVPYIVTCDVQVEVQWLVHERLRYESDTTPDIDNILKPMIDGLCGPAGVLADDCQLQSLSCHWIDWTSEEQRVEIRIRMLGQEWVSKRGIEFVQFDSGICYPIETNLPAEVTLSLLRRLSSMVETRRKFVEEGIDYSSARVVLPVQRPFHRSRIHGFTTRMLAHKLADLAAGVVASR